jgi:uncharacterized membrane protein
MALSSRTRAARRDLLTPLAETYASREGLQQVPQPLRGLRDDRSTALSSRTRAARRDLLKPLAKVTLRARARGCNRSLSRFAAFGTTDPRRPSEAAARHGTVISNARSAERSVETARESDDSREGLQQVPQPLRGFRDDRSRSRLRAAAALALSSRTRAARRDPLTPLAKVTIRARGCNGSLSRFAAFGTTDPRRPADVSVDERRFEQLVVAVRLRRRLDPTPHLEDVEVKVE